MGLGRHGGGAAAARYLAEQGAIVTVTDLADAAALAEPVAGLADAGIHKFHLGGHREADFRSAELVVVNPAVRPDNRWVELARQSGAANYFGDRIVSGYLPSAGDRRHRHERQVDDGGHDGGDSGGKFDAAASGLAAILASACWEIWARLTPRIRSFSS